MKGRPKVKKKKKNRNFKITKWTKWTHLTPQHFKNNFYFQEEGKEQAGAQSTQIWHHYTLPEYTLPETKPDRTGNIHLFPSYF